MTIEFTKSIPYTVTKDGKSIGRIQFFEGEWIFVHEIEKAFYGPQTKTCYGVLTKDEMLEVIKIIDSLECIK